MGKRGAGEGHIRKVRRVRKDGTVVEFWAAEVMVGYDDKGRRDRRYVTGPTREVVAAKIAELKAKKAKRRLAPRSSLTLAEYLRQWLESHRRYGARGEGLRPNTYEAYRNIIERHIIPFLGDKPLQQVTADDLERLYAAIDEKARERAKAAGRPPSRRMAQMAHRVLHRAFRDAVIKGRLEENPCDRVPSPPAMHYSAADRPWLDQADVPSVLEALKDTRYYLPLLLIMATGLRRNEAAGLTWEDVDFEAGVLHVRHQWGPLDEKGTMGLVPVKTRAGRRSIPLPEPVLDALAAHRVAQQAQGLGPLVFDRGDGRPIAPELLDAAWKKVREALKLPPIRLHDLRGSYLTWLAEAGVDLKTASELAGHSDVRITAQIYQRATARTRQQAADAIRRVLGAPPAE